MPQKDSKEKPNGNLGHKRSSKSKSQWKTSGLSQAGVGRGIIKSTHTVNNQSKHTHRFQELWGMTKENLRIFAVEDYKIQTIRLEQKISKSRAR